MLKAIIFDMDGTITKPYIDWKALRAEIGVPSEQMIIHYIKALRGEAKHKAEQILIRRENEAAAHSELNEGARELLSYLRKNDVSTALVTNNCRSSVDTVLKKHNLAFDLILTREDGETKPSGDLILKALARMGMERDEALRGVPHGVAGAIVAGRIIGVYVCAVLKITAGLRADADAIVRCPDGHSRRIHEIIFSSSKYGAVLSTMCSSG